MLKNLCSRPGWALVSMLLCFAVRGEWVAFNDFAPGLGTSSNATTYGFAQAGPLKDIATGAALKAKVSVVNANGAVSGNQARPDYGSPASVVFDGFVDFGGQPDPSIDLDTAADVLTYTFSGLDPSLEYNFQGTAIRGNTAYANRWSLFEIVGAASFTAKHSPGALTTAQVPELSASQVAINTGNNAQGRLAWWEHIRPAADGTFSVTSKHYTGTVPGGSSAGTIGYGMVGFRLEAQPVYSGRSEPPPRIPNFVPSSINGIKTVFLIVMENHDWDTIKGSSFCPYINNTLLPISAYCERYYSALGVHPSEPNYLWLIAGNNFGIHNDDAPSANHQNSTNTLFHQLDKAGIPWKTYQENISGNNVPDVSASPYAVRHNPFVFFDSVRTNLAYAKAHIRPYTELETDLKNNLVAGFNFISPNVTNDMHDLTTGSPSTRVQGDNWLAKEVPKILASDAYKDGGLLILTWDEGSADGDGPIGAIFTSPRVKSGGYHNSRFYNHSSTLRTLQDIFGVGPYLGDALYADNLDDLFKTIRVSAPTVAGDNFSVTASNLIPGKTHQLQSASDPAGPWTTVQSAVATQTTQSIAARRDGSGAKFYRVAELP